jgi:hypothetical protein
VVRRFQIRLPGVAGGGGPGRRLELVERVSMDARRSVALVRRDGREHLLLLAPEGNMVIESGIRQDEADREAARIRAEQAEQAAAAAAEAAERSRAEFKAMVDKASDRLGEVRRTTREHISGGLVGVREGARKAARKAADKAREAAERRREGRGGRVEDFGPPQPEVPPSVEAPAEARPAPEGLFAGLVDEAQAKPARKPRRPRQARTDKTGGQ